MIFQDVFSLFDFKAIYFLKYQLLWQIQSLYRILKNNLQIILEKKKVVNFYFQRGRGNLCRYLFTYKYIMIIGSLFNNFLETTHDPTSWTKYVDIYHTTWKNLRVSERHRVKNDERKWSERKRNLHVLVTMDTDSLSREVSNKRY
jgi:hypothetical protein